MPRPGGIAPCGTTAAYQWHKQHDEVLDRKCKQAWSEYHKEKRYKLHGLTREQFEALLISQHGLCAICGTDEPGGSGRWHIDHDHACCPSKRSCGRCIRGLLCMRCNMALGLLGDDEAALEAALRYLR